MTSSPDPSALPQPGQIIAGKYRVEGVLGAGGMGVVVAARHLVLGQRVAVKLLLPAAASLPEASARFLREARAAVAIQSEHVARVLDVGTLETGAPYMVMEHLAGEDLGRLVKTRGPLPIDVAVDFVLQAGEAIAEAHALGIVHRDLKPGNLFLTSRPDGSPLVKVLDFGLSTAAASARAAGPSEASLTATGFVMGSVFYMSPEQFRGLKYADARADIWALGVILYQLIAGRRPFEGESFGAVCASVIADAPAPLRAHRPDVPPDLEAVVLGCLQKEPDRRVQTVAELARRLAPFASSRASISVESILRVSRDDPASMKTTTAVAASVRLEPSAPVRNVRRAAAHERPRIAAIVLAGGVTAVLVVLGTATVLRIARGTEQAASEPSPAAEPAAPAAAPPIVSAIEAIAAPVTTGSAEPATALAPSPASAVAPVVTAPGTQNPTTPAPAPKPASTTPKPAAAKPAATPPPVATAAPAAPSPASPPPSQPPPKPTYAPAFEVPEEN